MRKTIPSGKGLLTYYHLIILLLTIIFIYFTISDIIKIKNRYATVKMNQNILKVLLCM